MEAGIISNTGERSGRLGMEAGIISNTEDHSGCQGTEAGISNTGEQSGCQGTEAGISNTGEQSGCQDTAAGISNTGEQSGCQDTEAGISNTGEQSGCQDTAAGISDTGEQSGCQDTSAGISDTGEQSGCQDTAAGISNTGEQSGCQDTEAGISNTGEQSGFQDTAAGISNTGEQSGCQGLKPQVEMPNQKLPCELLLILFSYVPIPDDLVSVQRVCSGWRATAQHKSLWKNFTLILSGTLHDKKNIIIMPAVRNVAGEADSDFLYQILENVKKLCKLNVNFDPPLTFPQLMAVLRKHPGLESISLSLGAPDLWMCLKVLRTSKHLIEVNFYVHDSYQYSYTIDRILLQLFAIFTDSKNFPALRKTNLVDPPLYYNRGLVTPALSTFISEKSKQLLSVKMAVFYDLDMTNTVSKCTNLQELDLAIYMSNSADIFIDKMAELKSLSLRFDSLKYRDNFSKLQDYFHRGSWAYLTKVSFIGHVYKKRMEGGVLNAIIKNVKQLKDLHYSDGERNTNESELCEVGNLSKLANLSLSGLYSISKASMSCIANCSKLRSLKLEVYTHDDVIQDICYTLRQLVNLEEIFISVSKNPSLIHLTDKEEVKRFTSSYKPTSLT